MQIYCEFVLGGFFANVSSLQMAYSGQGFLFMFQPEQIERIADQVEEGVS